MVGGSSQKLCRPWAGPASGSEGQLLNEVDQDEHALDTGLEDDLAILLPTSWLLLLPPKTGSQWIVAALSAADVDFDEVGARHAELSEFSDSFAGIGSFVRHPVHWHASYWAYRNSDRSAWDSRWEFDALCGSSDWLDYVDAVARRCPGYAGEMFLRYTSVNGRDIDFIGRQENLRDDLKRLLTLAGARFNADAIDRLPRINRSANLPLVSGRQRSVLACCERAMLHRYEYEP